MKRASRAIAVSAILIGCALIASPGAAFAQRGAGGGHLGGGHFGGGVHAGAAASTAHGGATGGSATGSAGGHSTIVAFSGSRRSGGATRFSSGTSGRAIFWFRNAAVNANEWRRWRRYYGGYGFFGAGLPFAFGFGPGCDPFWAEPWAFGCDTFGYWDGFAGGLAGSYGTQSEQGFEQQEEQRQSELQQEEPQPLFIPPPDESSPEEIQAEKVLYVLYMKNGAVYAVTNYWLADGKLHYMTSYGGENTIEMSDLDLQKTVDVNAKRGINFTLSSKPNPGQQDVPQQ